MTIRMATVGLVLVASPAARAADPDPWLGSDKLLHFSLSAALAATAYGTTAAFQQPDPYRWAVGGGVALAAGVGKELWDLSGHGTASWRDLAWDGLGTLTGLLTAWLVDQAIQQATAPARGPAAPAR